LETTTRFEIRTATCPECGAEVRVAGRLMVGEVFGCGACKAVLEVESPDPVLFTRMARIEDEEEEPV